MSWRPELTLFRVFILSATLSQVSKVHTTDAAQSVPISKLAKQILELKDEELQPKEEDERENALLRKAAGLPSRPLRQVMPYVFRAKPRNFNATEMIKLAMYRLMKEGGILQSEGFDRAGEISVSGTASIIMSRPFRNAEELVKSLDRSRAYRLTTHEVAVGLVGETGPFPLLTNYLLTPDDTERLKSWLERLQKDKDFKVRGYLKDRKLNVVISYHCCYSVIFRALVSRYGRLSIKVG